MWWNGRHGELKPLCLRACGFDSCHRHMGSTQLRTRAADENGLVMCANCAQRLPTDLFTVDKPYSDGTIRYTSYCRPCSAVRKNSNHHQRSVSKLWKDVAPLRAAKRMVEEHPETLVVLQRAFPGLWHQYVEQERALLIKRKQAYLARQKARDTERRKLRTK